MFLLIIICSVIHVDDNIACVRFPLSKHYVDIMNQFENSFKQIIVCAIDFNRPFILK
jgi:hypothetical protein